ncbi:MAG: SGNH/GDSL hydrolase family protein [Bryobacterales bacterium]
MSLDGQSLPESIRPASREERIGRALLVVLAVLCCAVVVTLVAADAPKSAYYVPVGLLAAAALGGFLRGARRARLAVMLFVMAPLPWLVEAAAGWLERAQGARLADARLRYAQEKGIAYDQRSSREVVEDLRRQGRDAWPAVHPSTLLRATEDGSESTLRDSQGRQLQPLAGIANVETVYGNEEGRYLIYRSDEHGFHNPPGIWPLPQIDVAAVGDSFTQGASVPSERNLVAVVRRRWPLTLNLGYGGNGPLTELAALLEYLPRRRPRVVLWVVCEVNDLGEDLNRELTSPLLLRYWQRTAQLQNLEQRQPEIDAALRDYVEKLRSSDDSSGSGQRSGALAFVALERVRRAAYSVAARQDDQWDAFSGILGTARDAVHSWGGALYLVYLPVHYTVEQSSLRHWQQGTPEQRRQRILDIARALEIKVIDIEPVFEQAGQLSGEFLYPYPGHFTAEGYEAAGQAIVERLETDGW